MTGKLVSVAVLTGTVLCAGTVSATPQSTLEKCQKTVKTEGAKFVAGRVKAVEACLAKIAMEVIKENDPPGDAASSCVGAFRKLNNAADPTKTLEAKMTAKITKACDPTSLDVEHTLQDILGTGAGVPQSIHAENLNASCAQFGGDGALNTFPEWIDCIVAANECAANTAVAVHYPRALQWFDQVRPAMLTLPPPTADAVAALDAVNGQIEGNNDDNVPNLVCGSSCGDGVKNGGDQCDGADLGGASCLSLGFSGGSLGCTAACGLDLSTCGSGFSGLLATGQVLCSDSAGVYIPCAGTGQDGDILAGSPLAYTDNNNGTITDLNTGLVWEKKSDDGSIHDWDTAYTWDDAFAVHIATLNSSAFAGHMDWRLPNRRELESIVYLQWVNAAVDLMFQTGCTGGCTVTTCSCTANNDYWTSTTYADNTLLAWFVEFYSGATGADAKTTPRRVRAVRGGL
jgi:hypothetical protein